MAFNKSTAADEYITLQLRTEKSRTFHARNEMLYFICEDKKIWLRTRDENDSLILIKDSLKSVEKICGELSFLHRINK